VLTSKPLFSALCSRFTSDTRSIFIVKVSLKNLEQISTQNTFLFYLLLAKSSTDFTKLGTNFCRMKRLKTQPKSGPDFSKSATDFGTSKIHILSHFYNILHLDSKLVMMPIYPSTTLLLSSCFIFPCFKLHQVAPQVSTQPLQPSECLPPS